jgi:hypothetical protein
MFTFMSPSNSVKDFKASISSAHAEAVIYTPHGVYAESIPDLLSLSTPISTLAVLHGLHAIWLNGLPLNLGAQNGFEIQKMLKAKYWIGTHDEVKKGGGLVAWFLKRKIWQLSDVLNGKSSRTAPLSNDETPEKEMEAIEALHDFRYAELGNGESMTLS